MTNMYNPDAGLDKDRTVNTGTQREESSRKKQGICREWVATTVNESSTSHTCVWKFAKEPDLH